MDKDDFSDRLSKALHQTGSVGLVLGIMISRELLQRSGESEAAELIGVESLRTLLNRVESGDLIMQDQLLTGLPYNHDVEETFQKISSIFLEMLP